MYLRLRYLAELPATQSRLVTTYGRSVLYAKAAGSSGLTGSLLAHHFLMVGWSVLLPFIIFSAALLVWSTIKLRKGERALKRQRRHRA